jgi:uncharacterized protein
MELSQTVEIPLPPAEVWRALNDPQVLQQCLPGCEVFAPLTANSYRIVMVASVGPVKATFEGEVTLSDLDPPHGYTLTGAGKGGVAGFAKGSANVRLLPIDRDGSIATAMEYEVTAAIGGKLAQIGSRLVSGAARKMANEFFTNFVRVACGHADGTLACTTREN